MIDSSYDFGKTFVDIILLFTKCRHECHIDQKVHAET